MCDIFYLLSFFLLLLNKHMWKIRPARRQSDAKVSRVQLKCRGPADRKRTKGDDGFEFNDQRGLTEEFEVDIL